MTTLAEVESLNLPPDEKRVLLNLLKEKEKRVSHRKLYTYFPDTGPLRRELYKKHMLFFQAGVKHRERCIMAANRVGKTEGCTCYEGALHMTGQYPEWWKGRRYDRPVRAWFCGTTAETTRDIVQRKLLGTVDDWGTGLIPGDTIVGEPRRDSGIPDAVETFAVRHVSGGTSRGQFKSYKQGRKSFEGDEQDIIVLDEEPPMNIYGECLIRTMTTGGMILLGFTPLDGITETVLAFMPGGTIPKGNVNGNKFIIGATWDDVPHLSQKDKEEILASTPVHLRNARSKGTPQIGSGLIYPVEEELIKVVDFPLPDWWPRFYAMDVGWNCTAASWFAWDREVDCLYINRVYKRGQAEPASHVAAIKAPGEWIPGVTDPASTGSSQFDGKKLYNEYVDLGLDLTFAENAVEAGLFAVYQRMTSGRFKVFESCTEWFEEYRLYRRDKNGKVVKKNDHLMDTTRYGVMSGTGVAKVFIKTVFRNMSVSQIMNTIPLGAR